MPIQALIAGGGIGGLAAALACARAGCSVRVLERADTPAQEGAGIQLGPNVTRVLQAWGLGQALAQAAAFPSRLQVRSARDGHELGVLRLGADMRQRYGTPYATLHRADLQQLLRAAVNAQPNIDMRHGCAVASVRETASGVQVVTADGQMLDADLLLGADGLWSVVREHLLADGPPRVTGHLAYRALLPQTGLPQELRSTQVTAWLGPDLHVVAYPVRQGDWLNLVAVVHADPASLNDTSPHGWGSEGPAPALHDALAGSTAPLRDLVQAVGAWSCWVLRDRPPVRGPNELARGRLALLGDAAHPMRPYLAQGAGMAIEDAACLGRLLQAGADVPTALAQYAAERWRRVARVQRRSLRNGHIFHARGALRWARDLALAGLGERLLDLPWLYGYRTTP